MCRDPSGTMIAFGDMMRKQIVMPAHLMNDNEHMEHNKRNLFKDFSSVAQATGTYTGQVSHPLCFNVHPLACIVLSCCRYLQNSTKQEWCSLVHDGSNDSFTCAGEMALL